MRLLMKSLIFALLFLSQFSAIALAAGDNNIVGGGGVSVNYSPDPGLLPSFIGDDPASQTGAYTEPALPSYSADYSTPSTTRKTTSSLTPLSNTNSYNFSSTTSSSFSGNLYDQARYSCGLSGFIEADNANTELERVIKVGASYSQQKCIDHEKLAKIRAEADAKLAAEQTQQIKIQEQAILIDSCMAKLHEAKVRNLPGPPVCTIPNIGSFDAIK